MTPRPKETKRVAKTKKNNRSNRSNTSYKSTESTEPTASTRSTRSDGQAGDASAVFPQERGKHTQPKRSLSDDLRDLVVSAGGRDLTLGEIMGLLGDRSHAILLVIISFPFCQPISMVGLSTPFGLVLAFLGAFYALGWKPWLPRFLRDRVVPFGTLSQIISKLLVVTSKLEKILHPRLSWFCNDPLLKRVHGAFVVIMALILCLPLPLPASNMVAAIPILLIGLGLLEGDGFFLIAAYAASLLCFAYMGAILWMGEAGLSWLFF